MVCTPYGSRSGGFCARPKPKGCVKVFPRLFLFLLSCLLSAVSASAQGALEQSEGRDTLTTSITYDLATETAVGTGDYTAFQLVTNRHHVLGTRSNTAYVRGAVKVEHPFTSDLSLSAAVDGIASVHADHHTFLQQCYANLSWQSFFIEVGSREEATVLRDEQLSSGLFANGINAKPVPKVHFGTNGFWTIPFTKGWLQAHFDFGYGKFTDSGYREEMFQRGGNVNWGYATGAYGHQKHLYFRTNPAKRFFVVAGVEHAVQFGGTGYKTVNGELVATKKPLKLKSFFDVIASFGDKNYYENDVLEDWVFGNHLGSMTLQVGWNIDSDHLLQAYLDNPFEDGSGIRKGNGWDGLWGLQYDNKRAGRQMVRKAVVEYFQTTNQSGPLHWDSGDYPEPVRSQVDDFVVGNDNYYNHMFYVAYSHYGMTPGNALITSPIYNKDGQMSFRDNRVKAWHLGVNGEITDRLSYLVKGSYREGWGTYSAPLVVKHHSFDAMVQGVYDLGPWRFAAAYAFDKGNIYGDCHTFNLKIGFHGKIL